MMDNHIPLPSSMEVEPLIDITVQAEEQYFHSKTPSRTITQQIKRPEHNMSHGTDKKKNRSIKVAWQLRTLVLDADGH